MPVRVYTPVRICVDEAALSSRCGCIDDALAKAAGRALAKSREVVLQARGGYLGLRLFAPNFVWTGDGLSRIPAARREELEERWTETLFKAASRSGLMNLAEDANRAPDPLPDDVSERFDTARWNAAAAAYGVPSYDNEGKTISFEESAGLTIIAPSPKGKKTGFRWRAIRNFEDIQDALGFVLGMRDREIHAEYFGVIFVYEKDNQYWLCVYQRDLDHLVFQDSLVLTTYEYENGAWKEHEPDLASDAEYSMDFLGEVHDETERVNFFRKEFADEIKAFLTQKGETPTDEKVEQEVKRRAGQFKDPKLFRLHANSWQALLSMPADLPSQTFEVFPLAEWGEIADKPGEGKGGRGRKGGAADGKGLAGKQRGKGSADGKGKSGFIEGQDGEGGDTLFPTYPHEDGEQLTCDEGFEGEPSLTELGADGERLRPLIEELAQHLDMNGCEYAGRFCLNAARMIESRADDIAFYARLQEWGDLKPARSGEGNLGTVNFKPVPSVSIQLLRHLGAAAPLIDALSGLTQEIYGKPENAAKIQGYRHGNSAGWDLDFIGELLDSMGHSIGYVFAMTCRVLLLQLLRASYKGITERQNNPGYADRFEQLIKAQVTELDLMKLMLDQLKPFAPKSVGDEVGTILLGTWQEARHEVISMFELKDPSSSTALIRPGGTLEWNKGKFGIRDAKGYWWSRDELEAAIALRTAIAEAIDPLVIQIDADPELAARFRNQNDIKAELAKLLDEMERNNVEKSLETETEPYFAFKASKIYEAKTRFSGSARSGYDLSGIHKLAHEAIEDAFEGSNFYRLGIKYLFDVEMGKRAIGQFFEFTGVLLLSVLCAPLGVAVGGALAIYHEHEALEEQKLFKSLLNPELVITRAEVEIDLFLGELGIALAFIPEAGNILKGATGAGRALIKGELVALTKAVVKEVAGEVVKNLSKGLLEAFVKEFIKAEIINELVGKLIVGPVVEQIQADFERTLMAQQALEQ